MEIGLRDQKMLTIPNPAVNTIGEDLAYTPTLMSTRIFTLIMDKIFIWAIQIMRQMTTCTIPINLLLNHLALIGHLDTLICVSALLISIL